MAGKRTSRGVAGVLVGFVAGYVTAAIQQHRQRKAKDRRTNRLIAVLHGLVEKYAPLGANDDKTAG